MTLQPNSALTLDSIPWTTDPATFEWEWARRLAYIPGVGGSGTTQDFGRRVRDLVIRLDSGDGQVVTTAFLQAVDARYHQIGIAWPFVDAAHGIEGTVHVEAFAPRASRLPDLWLYAIALRAVTLTKWLGRTYPPGAPA